VDLGTLGGASFATAVNDLGQVVGYSYTTQGVQRAFLWLPRPAYGFDRGMHDLGALPGGWSHANDINNLGQIVGASRMGALDQYNEPIEHAFLWDPATHAMIDLGVLPNSEGGSGAWAINDAGQVVGSSVQLLVFDYRRAFIWLPQPAFGFSTGISPLAHGFFQEANEAYDINESGEIVGFSGTDIIDEWRAFIWVPQAAHGVDAGFHILPGLENTISAGAEAINSNARVVGSYLPPGAWNIQAFLWEDGEVTPLATDESRHIFAVDINDDGLVLGRFSPPLGGPSQDFIRRGTTITLLEHVLLPIPGGTRFAMGAMNNQGQLAGHGAIEGHTRALLVTPIVADVDADGDIDLDDFSSIVSCLAGPNELTLPECISRDLDADGDVDFFDITTFIRVKDGQ
jgi:probable HAF family extracellular repeat protein